MLQNIKEGNSGKRSWLQGDLFPGTFMDGSRYGGACNRDGLGRGFHAARLRPTAFRSELEKLTATATQIEEGTAP
jgi:hypothetical protein